MASNTARSRNEPTCPADPLLQPEAAFDRRIVSGGCADDDLELEFFAQIGQTQGHLERRHRRWQIEAQLDALPLEEELIQPDFDRPSAQGEETRTAFGFSDGLAKVVYDVRPRQQVSLSVLGGMSNIDGEEDNVAPNELGEGTTRASAVNLSWRSLFGSDAVLTQRAYIVRRHFLNKFQTGRDADRSANEEVVYRTDLARPIAGGLLEAGVQVGRTTVRDVPRSAESDDGFAGSSWQRSGYAHFAWAATPTLTLSPGLRVTSSTLLPHRTMTRWMLGEWAFRTGWTLDVSAGVSHQLPDLQHMLGRSGSAALRPERATHLDVAIEQRLSDSLRWQATVFNR